MRYAPLLAFVFVLVACAGDPLPAPPEEAVTNNGVNNGNNGVNNGVNNGANNGNNGANNGNNGANNGNNGANNGNNGANNGNNGANNADQDAGMDTSEPTDTSDGDTTLPDDTGEADVGEADADGPDAEPDTRPPVNCSGIVAAGFELCSAQPDACEAVFRDGEGCQAVCAAAGLECAGVFEDIADACAADVNRPALTCDPESGHRSDFCVCRRGDDVCTPSCAEGMCGTDGCGGRCACGVGEVCRDAVCVEEGPEDCDGYPFSASSLLDELEGFGRRTTGGDPNNIYRVTNDNNSGSGSLRRALESEERYWIVFDIGRNSRAQIDLDPDDPVRVRSHKTIDGRGRDVVINGSIRLSNVRNVIISDVGLTNQNSPRCTQEHDVVTVQSDDANAPGDYNAREIWLHHCELFDGGDGLFDIRGGSRITVSWNYWHTHSKAILIGVHGQPGESRETEVTFHHNYFERMTKRHPRMHYARAHAYNNYYFHWWEFAVMVADGGEFLSEGNIFEARPGETCGVPFIGCQNPAPCGDSDWEVFKEAIDIDRDDNHALGNARSVGDLLLNDASVDERGTVFTPGYDYAVEAATTELAEHIRENAGRRADYCR